MGDLQGLTLTRQNIYGLLAVLAVCHATPVSYTVQEEPRFVIYSPLNQQTKEQASKSVVIVPASASNIQQYAVSGPPVSAGGQYLVLYPGLQGVYRDTEKPEEGTTDSPFDNIYNFIVGIFGSGSSTENPAEEGGAESPDAISENVPDKITETSSTENMNEALENLDEGLPPTPSSPAEPQPGQKLFLIGKPQFFGNYDALKSPLAVQRLGNNGLVSSFLLFNGQQPVVLQSGYPGALPAAPGKAAIEFQKILSDAKQEQTKYSNKPSLGVKISSVSSSSDNSADSDKDSITVEALQVSPHGVRADEGSSEADSVNADSPPGPSVAQVKPQAIALAGPGGVAAAAPLGTALVGPGGLAVASPSATAVAGPSGGQPPISPGNQATALSFPAAYKAYLMAHSRANHIVQSS